MQTSELIEKSIKLAEDWQYRASELVSSFDRKFHRKMNKMMEHPEDKRLLIELMDQCFRAKTPARVANQIVFLLSKHGLARFFSPSEKVLLTFFKHLGVLAPQFSVPLFVGQIRSDSRTVVLDGEQAPFDEHLKKRRREGVDCICNLIGEIVLGEDEAGMRMEKYLNALENPNIEFLSIKLSTLYSQINPLDFEGTVETLVERLTLIYRKACQFPRVDSQGEKRAKFINLDMEEYRDLPITVEVFKRTLSKPEFQGLYAGIALQAYLPDSVSFQNEITRWATMRVAKGGSPVKIRLVKGANMEMELTEADSKGWPLVTYTEKLDTDANYKRMVQYALRPEHAQAVHVGVASHNLFEIAHAVVFADSQGTSDALSIEMLEGMSESARQAIHASTKPVMLYAPAAARTQFTNAIAYLVRRLDENTGEENFIRHSFGLTVGSESWEVQRELFVEAFGKMNGLNREAKRVQNRLNGQNAHSEGKINSERSFRSEADTDFVLEANQTWARTIVERWKFGPDSRAIEVPVVVAGESLFDGRRVVKKTDRSLLPSEVPIAQCAIASEEDIEAAITCAVGDEDAWRAKSAQERGAVLRAAARVVRERRGDLIGVAAAELGKVFTETDVEISEAIDFLELYSNSAEYWEKRDNTVVQGLGVGLVVPPWNFPIAIPLGGVAAALAAGNTVIIKPASAAIVCAYEFCKCFWDAGLSKKTLQLLPCPGSLAGKHLIPDERIDFVILTGGEDTAYSMLKARPGLFLSAETGGKDATIVTSMADREQAIRNVCHSAFSNSGQKCSATSLLILEKEVYEDPAFKAGLIDAAKSLRVGSPWDLGNKIGTLANPVAGALKRALETLDEGESWALEPSYAQDNPLMLKPCIKWGVQPGSFCHMTELFGPVLSVMCADDLEHAVNLVNATGYGLTSGLESLDEREIEYWKSRIIAGNLYINRSTTGAIVLRQPFGGLCKSAIGSGRKVGTCDYITQFMKISEQADPRDEPESSMGGIFEALIECMQGHVEEADLEKLKPSLNSYIAAHEIHFSEEHDFFHIRGESNCLRYLPVHRICIRVSKDDRTVPILQRVIGAIVSQSSFDVSFETEQNLVGCMSKSLPTFGVNAKVFIEGDENFCKRIPDYERIIYVDPQKVSKAVFEAASIDAIFIGRQATLQDGYLELLNYFNEQSISHSYHRYGNVGRTLSPMLPN